MQDLRINIIQADLAWEKPEENLTKFGNILSDYKGTQDLILLPEMFNTGFTMNARDFAEPMNGPAFQWMADHAKKTESVIAASIIIKEKDKFFNRLIWMRPDGTFESYNKRHLFRFGNENLFFEPGKSKLVVEIKGWKVCPMICYDLRFPVWAKNTYNNGVYEYDLLIYLANWPEKRKQNWISLLQARAIDNLSYCVGVNRVGIDGNNVVFSGNSLAYSPRGEVICAPRELNESNSIVTLSANDLQDYRRTFNVALDWDGFELV